MARFADLPPMAPPRLPRRRALGVDEELAGGKPLCGGCGSKVGGEALSRRWRTCRPAPATTC